MGQYRVTVTAVGSHGCQREIKDGGTVGQCTDPNCPDCKARRFVADLQAESSVESAKLEHWPGQPSQVTDDLVSGIRSGSF